ncbi:nitroreductase family protein [Acidaminococcus sp.]|uniref:nitroreductase family protein n=1 Tax=Acidaminococcus sp. TaxID=1872103 RepID=UPI003D7C64DB
MELAELYRDCRTYRRFTQEPVPAALVRGLVDVARQRSCGRNGQVLRYVSVTTPENVKAMQPLLHWAAALPKEIGTPREGEQPTAFVVVAKPKDANPIISNIDLGIALDAMAITAWQQGVGSAILAAVDRAKIAALLGLPEGLEVNVVLALGHPSHKSTLVPAEEEKPLAYYVDEKRDYYVPKLSLEAVLTEK